MFCLSRADITGMIENNSGRTYKDLIKTKPQSMQRTGMMGKIVEYCSYAIHVPVIGRLLCQSFDIVSFALGRYRRKGDYGRLYGLLLNCLSGPAFRGKRADRWWYFMRFAVAVVQERQINWMIRDVVLEDNLTLLGNLGPRPLQGYDVAYAFVGYSLWLFERGDVWAAISMIKIAEQADVTWGYPEYLHGWYGLFTSGVNSVEHFSRAVQIDWSFLQRMKHDKTCREHPEVLHEVQRRSLVAK
jgi:hypothetical protein